MDNNLEVISLCTRYKNSDFSVEDISFLIPKGSILGVIGENGAGKTTMLNTIIGLKEKTSGSVKIFGKDYDGENMDIKEELGVVFDDIYLPNQLTAKEISSVYKNIYKKWDEKFFIKTLEKFQISVSKKIKDYSKGMQKMLSIAVGMSHHPRLLILDEPTSSLDPVKRQDLLGLFQEYVENGENSILVSSHITTDLEKVADYVMFIKAGKIVFCEEITKLIYEYGLVRCSGEIFDRIPKKQMIVYQNRDYQNLVLVKNRTGIEDMGSRVSVENPALEDIMKLFSRGVIV